MSYQVISRIASVGAYRSLSDGAHYLIYSALYNYYNQFTCAEMRKFLKASGYSESTLYSVREYVQFMKLLGEGWPGPEVSYE